MQNDNARSLLKDIARMCRDLKSQLQEGEAMLRDLELEEELIEVEEDEDSDQEIIPEPRS